MYITHGKTICLVGMEKPKEAQLQGPAHMKIPAIEAHVSCPIKFQYNLTTGAHHHQFQLDRLDQKRTHVQQGLNPSLLSSFSSFLI